MNLRLGGGSEWKVESDKACKTVKLEQKLIIQFP